MPTNGTLYQTGGVYAVIGGAGYLGEAWSEYMIRRYKARIIWIGRSTLNDSIQAKLDRLSAFYRRLNMFPPMPLTVLP